MAKPKLHEVAAIAEVSEATVSRVINRRPGVAEATRHRVLDALTQLGYHLGTERTRGSGFIGILTPELDNPIFPFIAQAVESKLARQGLLSVVAPATPTTGHERDYLQHFKRTGAAGVVIINGSYAKLPLGYSPYQELLDDGLAVVLVNGVDVPCPIPAVTVDMEAAAASAVGHLARLGHETIGAITGPPENSSARDLASGFAAALAAHGLSHGPGSIKDSLFTVEGAKVAAMDLAGRGVTGIFAGGDMMALGAIQGADAIGLRVPEDLSIVGFDGTPLVGLSSRPLTTLRQPVDRMAQTVVMMMLAQFNGGAPPTQVFRAELIAGATTTTAPNGHRSGA